ncbi:MAG: carboxypeptidase regulatory-like domain-containing protein [Planctomycetes bacterium]|nr:carboxypeptidase regulatory-like domain-containing protein [Planctomycetota bacterium]
MKRIFVAAVAGLLVALLVLMWPARRSADIPTWAISPKAHDTPLRPDATDAPQPQQSHGIVADEDAVSPRALPDDTHPRSLQLLVTDEREEALAHLQFEYALLQQWLPTSQPPETAQGSTDSTGIWHCDAKNARFLYVRVSDHDGVCAQSAIGTKFSASRSDHSPTQNFQVFDFGFHPSPRCALKLRKVITFMLSVAYSDGVPFEGKVTASYFTDEQLRVLEARSRDLIYEPNMIIRALGGTCVRISGRANRGGFASHFGVSPATTDVLSGAVLIVLPTDASRPEPSGFILDHRRLREQQVMQAQLLGRDGAKVGPVLQLDGPGETKAYASPNRVFSFVAIGDGTLWASTPMVLEAGEWIALAVEPQLPAALSLLVRDEDGNPVPGAILSASEVGRVHWRDPTIRVLTPDDKRQPSTTLSQSERILLQAAMSRAVSDNNGRINLNCTWPGDRLFTVEAIGCEPETISVSLRPGMPTEASVVTLRRATARVEITLVGEGEDPQSYEAMLWMRSGGAIHRNRLRFPPDGVLLLEQVPAGSYQVWVSRYPKGGSGWSRMIELTPHKSERVSIDVTQPAGVQSD